MLPFLAKPLSPLLLPLLHKALTTTRAKHLPTVTRVIHSIKATAMVVIRDLLHKAVTATGVLLLTMTMGVE
ncbi:hypothetical protein JD844_017531 [Phrynosoma platyrhinos]|uniref:Secreted protein n=1 Tax=Phrynosoma platyrhinos TaxID=52577 RepID=A0ABQ7SM38_PHRPL|nr:hypothetical protein JD844_017531 [Phrynosoma platyrhinos]